MSEKPFEQLIKERKEIVRTITKVSDEMQTRREVRSLGIACESNTQVAQLIAHTPTTLTMRHYDGLSLFRVLELLHKQDEQDTIHNLLDHLAHDVSAMQSSCTTAIEVAYPFGAKLQEISGVLRTLGHKTEGQMLEEISPELITLLKQAPTAPFRDATPKNYIVHNATETNLTGHDISANIIAIDFATFHYGTHPYDDLISLFYHYMVSDAVRTCLIETHTPKMTPAVHAMLILRLGRFWARRVYYRQFHPTLFRQRYREESIAFYEQHFFDALHKYASAIK